MGGTQSEHNSVVSAKTYWMLNCRVKYDLCVLFVCCPLLSDASQIRKLNNDSDIDQSKRLDFLRIERLTV